MDIIEIDIIKEISGDLYYRLIDFAVGRFPVFVFVIGRNRRLQENVQKIVDDLTPYLIKRFYDKEWPGTEILEGQVEVFHFELNHESAYVLKKYTSSLYQWKHPILPEDLSIMRNSTQPWLCNIAHDDAAVLYVSPTEKAELLEAIPELPSFFGEERKPFAYYE